MAVIGYPTPLVHPTIRYRIRCNIILKHIQDIFAFVTNYDKNTDEHIEPITNIKEKIIKTYNIYIYIECKIILYICH